MNQQETLPPILPHTEAKHDILKYHMGAWFPILGRSFPGPLQYIDGFAGPGEYEGGELGSPLITMDVVRTHAYLNEFDGAGRKFQFLFVEDNPIFARHLQLKVAETTWPTAFDIDLRNDEFEAVMVRLLDDVDNGRRRMPPTLLLIDPFGSAGFTMKTLARLASHPRIDLLINFNYLDLNRWILPDPIKHVTLDGLYGGDRWRPALDMQGDAQKNFLIREYGLALLESGWRNTSFEMINRQNQTQYYLFFGTQSSRGMQVIKQAMRSVSPDGLYRYADRTDPAQLRFIGMGMDEEYARELATFLFSKYRGTTVAKDEISENDVAWHARWVDSNLTMAMRMLESTDPPQITNVRNSDGRRRQANSFPPGCFITFAP